MGIHEYEKGEIRVDGKDVRTQPLACKKVCAYIPDNPDIYEYLTGIQYLNFIADIYQVPGKVREERIRREAEEFGIFPVLGDLVSTYSHGMRQKLVLIGALLHEPKLLILDEPFVGLDPEASLILKGIEFLHSCTGGGGEAVQPHCRDFGREAGGGGRYQRAYRG